MDLSELMTELEQETKELVAMLAKEQMRVAVLEWANANKDALKQAGLVDSLLAALDAART